MERAWAGQLRANAFPGVPKAIPHKAHDWDMEPDADGPAALPRGRMSKKAHLEGNCRAPIFK